MKRILALVITLGLVAAVVYAFQSPASRDAMTAPLAGLSPSREVVIPAGTAVTVRLENYLGTGDSKVNDRFQATVARPVVVGEQTAIPEGAGIMGHVVAAKAAGHISGHGQLQLQYDQVEIGSQRYALDTRGVRYETGSGAKRSAGLIGGGAVLGGLIGGVAGKSGTDAAKGAVIGGAAGTAASMASPRPELNFAPGHELTFRLDRPITVRLRAT